MQPLDTINDPGFRHMLKEFEPRYQPPDRKTIAVNYLPAMYEERKKFILQKLEKAKSLCCYYRCLDFKSQSTLTVHFIDKDYMLHGHILETREFTESHTAQNIGTELNDSLADWDLTELEMVGITTDNGANIVSAINLLGWSDRHVPCFSHTLQLGVQKAMAIPSVSKALGRCRRLVGHFHHSSKSNYLLQKKQEALNHPKHALVQNVITRWNSSFYMAERILEQQQPLCAALLN